MTSSQFIIEDRSTRGVTLLTLNRPDKLNALSRAVLEQLRDALDRALEDASVGCVVLTENGGEKVDHGSGGIVLLRAA